ncbi:DUF1214 domain-containing protein [Tianweitania sp. BSSL-BM11]|uniref:DUF1214 domain-containing protein n=1 Tax=Tianweitania aestuarii TaxID=2814886 RepID=A0ABS5RW02_9HYPH|nr:DUF1214 domain-containing protein [Tianweitania aestuarii]MBS9719877.1 DUF1214 domain-containing protein [Tianweitania aestuarii]
MLKTVLLVCLALAIAIGGGAGSVLYALNHSASFGAIHVGPWVAFPDIGTPDADPYMQARYAREGGLALGRAEGVEFRASEDTENQPLSIRCRYRVEGETPPARFWTLYATDEKHALLDGIGERAAATSSLAILREAETTRFVLEVGAEPVAGNWLPVSGTGSMQLVLTLYDTPIANRTDLTDSVLPSIRRIACDG